jgi:hypothetical protein
MRTALLALVCSALVGLVALPPPALAQQKTVKACRDEWSANKAANQAAGVTEKAYVDKCRGGDASAQPAATPAAATTPASSGQKTVKDCRGEWTANKAAYQAGGVTEKAYVDKCRAGETVAVPSATTPVTTAAPAATPAAAAQKTAKECRGEWTANKAAYQAGGVTEKAYVDKCRAGETVAVPSATTPVTTAAPAATPAAAPQKTVKACRDEWSASKAAFQAGGITEKAYVDKCRAGETVEVPTATTPTATTPATTPVSAPPAKPGKTAVTTPTGADQFATELLAKGHCPADTVVWANTDTKVYHFSGNKRYGNTKQGAYMCEKDAGTQGFRAAKNEKHT